MKNQNFSRFFNPQKSPSTQSGDVPKNPKPFHKLGEFVWISIRVVKLGDGYKVYRMQGTYERNKHGKLK